MKFTRFAKWATGMALFYDTAAGPCQSISAGPEANPPTAQQESANSVAGAPPARARMSVQFIATGAKASDPTPNSCQKILAVLLPYIQAYPHPDSWSWFVACDEAAWGRIQLRQGNQVGSGILAITNRGAHSTIIRGSAMLHAYSDDYRAQPEHIIAHELCHVYLQSSDEHKVDDLATRWVAERKALHLAVLRP